MRVRRLGWPSTADVQLKRSFVRSISFAISDGSGSQLQQVHTYWYTLSKLSCRERFCAGSAVEVHSHIWCASFMLEDGGRGWDSNSNRGNFHVTSRDHTSNIETVLHPFQMLVVRLEKGLSGSWMDFRGVFSAIEC